MGSPFSVIELLARAQERWNDQAPNDKGAAEMIREDRDAG